MWLAAVPFAALLATAFSQKDPHYDGNRTTMVHLFEWKFDDIADECEQFLGPMGYGGVQVSPIHENLILPDRNWYERYQPISYKIVTRSGDEAAFRDMVRRCNAVGVRIYVDIVINHMTADKSPAIGTGGSVADTEKRNYSAVPYTLDDFHSPCAINNYSDPNNVRNCELEGLHDLDHQRENVRRAIIEFCNRVIDAGVAGLRVDAAKHMWPEDLDVIYSRMNDLNTKAGFPPKSRAFIYQEVIDLGNEGVSKREYNSLAAVIEFQFGIVLGYMFRGLDNLSRLSTWENCDAWNLLPSSDALVMVDNHDNQRGHGAGGKAILTYKDPKQYKMAVAFMQSHPYGMPRIMSSFEFDNPSHGPPMDSDENIISPKIAANGSCTNGWVCEHRWPEIYNMVAFRNLVNDEELKNWWTNGDNQIAFSRGAKGFAAFNVKGDLRETLQTGLPAGTYCDVMSGDLVNGKCTGKTVQVGPDGRALIEILRNETNGALAVHIKAKL